MVLYLKIANKYHIIDEPNERSSHTYIPIRGGGIVWWIAGIIYSLLHLPESVYFLTGISLIAIVSFWDDVASLPINARITVHFVAAGILLYGLGLLEILSWWQIPIAFIFIAGIWNAFNFMDGINGITGLYSLTVLIALQYVNYKITAFTPPDFINYAIIACIVFLFFNFKKQAKCFAGDIGSLAVSFWIVSLTLQLMLKTKSIVWIGFLTVYGVDSIGTILHRLFLRQNIFTAHRMHLYQMLTNQWEIPHLKVAAGYALIQIVICAIIIILYSYSPTVSEIAGIGLLLLCCLIYLLTFIPESP